MLKKKANIQIQSSQQAQKNERKKSSNLMMSNIQEAQDSQTQTSEILHPSGSESTRMARLLRMVQEIRLNPRQSVQKLWKHHNISKTQFYKDRATLAECGFCFTYTKTGGFVITEDRLTPLVDLTLSDRLFLMFALENLSARTDGHLAAMAVEVGRKLSSGLESPFKEHLEKSFDEQVMEGGFGVYPDNMTKLRDAIIQAERIRILYLRSEEWTTRWREIEPRRIYLRERSLYVYARTVDETPPKWKTFRINRIKDIQKTGISSTWHVSDDDEFEVRQSNAFFAFIGDSTHKVTVRFKGEAVPFILEKKWHKSQKLIQEASNSVLWSVVVAEPKEVERWIRQFADNAELISVEKITEN